MSAFTENRPAPAGGRSRLLSRVLALAAMSLAFVLFPRMTAYAEIKSYPCSADGSSVTCSLDTASGVFTVSGTGNMKDYSAWALPWKNELAQIKTVNITNGVVYVGNYAFYSCANLSSVTIAGSVKSIGNAVFSGCSSLGSIEIPAGVTSIPDSAFSGCSSLSTIKIPDSVKSIGDGAFSHCSSLKSIKLPSDVTSIGGHAFYDCSFLESIEIPAGVTSIGSHTFADCSSLKYIEIPAGVTSIGINAFDNSSLTSIEIPGSVTSIGDSAFYGCKSLSNIVIKRSAVGVLNLGADCFGDNNITSAYLVAADGHHFEFIVEEGKGYDLYDSILCWEDHTEETILTTTLYYTVTLDRQSGSGGTASVTAAYGATMPTPITLPTRTGYTFGGYFTEANGCGTQYYNADGTSANNWNITENTTLYAKWTGNRYTVTLDQTGATTQGITSVTATYGSAMPRITNLPSRTGYTFEGYFTEPGGQGTQYYTKNGTSLNKWDIARDTSLFPKWTARTFTVTLDQTDAETFGAESVTATYNAEMPAITSLPARTGYTFGGYFTETNGGGTQYYNADGTSAKVWDRTDGATLYPKWTGNRYTVALDQTGATTQGITSVTATYGSALPRISNLPSRTGYTFEGYFTEPGGQGTQYYTKNGTSANKWNIAKDTKLYPKWKARTYTVTLDQTDADTPGTPSVTTTYGAAMPTPITLPARDDYTFGGYFTETNGGGTQYYNADGTSAKNWDRTGDTTLYALWGAAGRCGTNVNWEISGKTMTFTPSGSGAQWHDNCSQAIYGHADQVTVVKIPAAGNDKIKAPDNSVKMFKDLNKITSMDLSGLDTDDVTDMSSMFAGCSGLTSLDLSSFDTGNVTDMSDMFGNMSSLQELKLGQNFKYKGKGNPFSGSTRGFWMRSGTLYSTNELAALED